MVLIENYDSYPRLARITEAGEADRIPPYEELSISGSTLRFATDGATYVARNTLGVNKLGFHEGDIVSITQRGRINKLFDYMEHNATVYVTGRCNSNCVMCPCSDYERKTSDGMSDGWLRAYIDMMPSDVPHVVVTGGEPTLKTQQFLLAMDLIACKLPTAETLLLTNGRSFASTTLLHKMLDRCPQLLMAGIPIHGASEELHDRVTRSEGSFKQTCKGIVNLLANSVAVEIRIVVSKLNTIHLLDIAKLVAANFPDVSVVTFMGLETMGNCAQNFSSVYIDCKESWEYVEPAIDYLLSAGIDAQIYNYPLCSVNKGYWSLCRKSITPSKVRYPADCESCVVKEGCGGFFSTTLRMANPKPSPIASLN